MKEIRFTRPALKDVESLPRQTQAAVHKALARYVESGHGDVIKMRGRGDDRRLRVGRHRVIFRLDGDVIDVIAVRARKDAYK